jgi:hypothetical protein
MLVSVVFFHHLSVVLTSAAETILTRALQIYPCSVDLTQSTCSDSFAKSVSAAAKQSTEFLVSRCRDTDVAYDAVKQTFYKLIDPVPSPQIVERLANAFPFTSFYRSGMKYVFFSSPCLALTFFLVVIDFRSMQRNQPDRIHWSALRQGSPPLVCSANFLTLSTAL